jgi:hypothetical protein
MPPFRRDPGRRRWARGRGPQRHANQEPTASAAANAARGDCMLEVGSIALIWAGTIERPLLKIESENPGD